MDQIPALDEIAQKTALTPPFKEVVERLRKGSQQIYLHGLPTTLQSFLMAHVQRSCGRPLLMVTADESRAEKCRDDMQAIIGEDLVRYFPGWDVDVYDARSPDAEIVGLRLEAAAQLHRGECPVIVAPVAALLLPLIPPHALELGTLHLKIGTEHRINTLTGHLTDSGFESVATLDGLGQYSVRGGILDVYPYGVAEPFRLEFFGDEIESIRTFDLATQRSRETVSEAVLVPAGEVLLGNAFCEEYLVRLGEAEREYGVDLVAVRDILKLGSTSLEGIEAFMPILYGRDDGLFAYLRDAVVCCDEREDLEAAAGEALKRPQNEYEKYARRGNLLPPHVLVRDWNWLSGQLNEQVSLEPAPLGTRERSICFWAKDPPLVKGELPLLRRELQRLEAEGYVIHLRCETQGQTSRLQELFEDWPDFVFGLGSLHQGFVFPAASLALFNDHEIFSREKRRYRYRKFRSATPITASSALQCGDYVVHVDHGVGRYLGIRRLNLGKIQQDCLEVTYQSRDKLFVPIEQLDRLRKYSSAEDDVPILSKLGGAAWEKLKERTRAEIFKMAGELVELYAERKARPGFTFTPDGDMQREMEAAFPFRETRDQQRTINEVKADMEASNPMDRLVCGDVGYGKTEVAIRAAFKAVCAHKQVAVLVPTTILAEQHFHTFSERMQPFPTRVEVLSRFRTATQQKAILADVANGRVDILIGTHRLLSKDVKFHDLGLLVVDEEQRFGVRHKEKLKQVKRLVDVVAMTATPIPRTLHMSMMGARDMSVINTPPQDRLSIHTEILAFDEERIATAILREIERGGQVYFVHNRVQSIYRMAEYLGDLLPQVRFAVAHGQMAARQLEQIMFDFMERKYDCLVSTMIIESGIDIPSVNSIVVNRADRLGLSQLYQIRGRVGRSNERAYAYLVVPKGKKLTKKSRMRLRAIEEFADLGSGFNIAMRDMEIRGAGNLLGSQQHGFITAVGFDLYCRLLEEAMREVRGETVTADIEPDIRIAISSFIPDDYVPDLDQKMNFYQRLADAQRLVELLAIREEMQDRFGRMPFHAQALMCIMEIRVVARQLGLATVHLEKGCFKLVFPENRQVAPDEVQRLVERSPLPLNFSVQDQLAIEVNLKGDDEQERLEKARDLMVELV